MYCLPRRRWCRHTARRDRRRAPAHADSRNRYVAEKQGWHRANGRGDKSARPWVEDRAARDRVWARRAPAALPAVAVRVGGRWRVPQATRPRTRLETVRAPFFPPTPLG